MELMIRGGFEGLTQGGGSDVHPHWGTLSVVYSIILYILEWEEPSGQICEKYSLYSSWRLYLDTWFALEISSFLCVLYPTGRTGNACVKKTKLCYGLVNRI